MSVVCTAAYAVDTLRAMAKTPVNLRLDARLLARIDAYAAERLSNRTAVVQAACLAFLGDAEGGVPDLPPAARGSVRAVGQQRAREGGPKEWAMERQRRLNAGKKRES